MKNITIEPLSIWFPAQKPVLIAGPCSAETEEQVLTTAHQIAERFPDALFRAGIWKPRTRPNAFEGLGAPALEWLKKVKEETGLRTSTEVANAEHTELALKAGVDVLWIGARSTVNPFSVQEIADVLKGVDIPVLIKNPVHPDIQLWLGAIERVSQAGITKLAAIHRGFHSATESSFRNKPHWNLAIELKRLLPELPLICDPSHICGNTELIPFVAQKALDLDMAGLMLETHIHPQLAWSDAKQQLTPDQLSEVIGNLKPRNADFSTEEGRNKLGELRESINKLDSDILQIMSDRMQVAKRIGEYKKENEVTVLQVARWDEILNSRISAGSMLGLEKEFVTKLYSLIHKESIDIQNKIMNC